MLPIFYVFIDTISKCTETSAFTKELTRLTKNPYSSLVIDGVRLLGYFYRVFSCLLGHDNPTRVF